MLNFTDESRMTVIGQIFQYFKSGSSLYQLRTATKLGVIYVVRLDNVVNSKSGSRKALCFGIFFSISDKVPLPTLS